MTLQQVKNHMIVFKLSYAKARTYIVGLLVSSIVVVCLSVLYNISTGKIIDFILHVLTNGGALSQILVPTALFMATLVGTMFFENLTEYFGIIYNNMIDLIMDDYKFHKNLSLDPQTYIDPDFTVKKNVLDWNGWKVTQTTRTIIALLTSFIPSVFYTLILLTYNTTIGVLAIISAIPTIYANVKYGKRVWAIWDDNSGKKIEWSLYRNALHGSILEPKVMGFGQYIIDKMLELHHGFVAQVNLNERRRLIAMTLLGVLEYAVLAGAYLMLFNGIIQKNFTVGDFMIITASLWGVKRTLNQFFENYATLESNANFVDDFIVYMNWKPIIVSPINGISIDHRKPLSIEFRHVWFKYPRSKNWVFKDLSITLSADEDIALVGKNGAGKTTFVKLLMRIYDPDKGEILINGTSLKQIDLNSYYKAIGYLGQSFKTYEFSARENIILGDISNSEKRKDVEKYAKLAHADEMIQALKKGYDTFLTTNLKDGQVLSGGQEQRLAIARVFYREPQLLILDEPTSAIDALAEEQIFDNIFEFSEKRTVIIISHRFATVKKAQRILVLDDGEIVESGSHKELLEQNGLYAAMYNAQTTN